MLQKRAYTKYADARKRTQPLSIPTEEGEVFEKNPVQLRLAFLPVHLPAELFRRQTERVSDNLRMNNIKYAESMRKTSRNAKLNVRKWRRCVEKPSSAREARVEVTEASVDLAFLVPVVVCVRGDSKTAGKALVV